MRSLEIVGAATAERLSLQDYKKDFQERQWVVDGPGDHDSWKLERQQEFQEPGFGSWEAFSRGDWSEALRLIEEEREYLEEFSRKAAGLGITLYRVRVVEEPIVPYLQWELHLLRLREECGERIRVLGPGRLRDLERAGPLPELLTLGRHTLYQILYDERGVLDGAVRFTQGEAVERSRQLIKKLYLDGEDLSSYFARKVAQLPPPRVK